MSLQHALKNGALTQAVERAVKLMTEASTHAVNPIERDGYT